MPELPEVQTTVNGIHQRLRGQKITNVWTDYYSEFHIGKQNIKNRTYFKKFKKSVTGTSIIGASRRGKNVLIHLSNDTTILVHMKMTGHLLYGRYVREKDVWKALDGGPLRDDSFNGFIHVVFTLSTNHHLVLSDVRKFAKVTLITETLDASTELAGLGPEPLTAEFTLAVFKKQLSLRPHGAIKQVLMNQEIIAGIGNIYSDETLFIAGIHPLEQPSKIPDTKIKVMYEALRNILKKSLEIGGDSESDYRNIDGEKGNFQNKTKVYGHRNKPCQKPGCTGIIARIKVGGRSAHFCPVHQALVKNGINAVSLPHEST